MERIVKTEDVSLSTYSNNSIPIPIFITTRIAA